MINRRNFLGGAAGGAVAGTAAGFVWARQTQPEPPPPQPAPAPPPPPPALPEYARLSFSQQGEDIVLYLSLIHI